MRHIFDYTLPPVIKILRNDHEIRTVVIHEAELLLPLIEFAESRPDVLIVVGELDRTGIGFKGLAEWVGELDRDMDALTLGLEADMGL